MKTSRIYGAASQRKIRENPYRLMDEIEGVGFLTAGRIALSVKDMRDVTPGTDVPADEAGVFIANPPYGERLDNTRAAHAVARQLGALQKRCPGWKLCAFSADLGFEKEYGRRATRRRRYYNGRIECEYRIFE